MGRKKSDSVIGVYILHNQETGEGYIGSGILNARRNSHFNQLRNNNHVNGLLQKAYNRNENFEFIGVEVEGDTVEEARLLALRIEANLVSEQSDNSSLLNLMRNGIENREVLSHTEESREKMSRATSLRWQDPVYRERTAAAQKEGWAAMSDKEKITHSERVSKTLKYAYDNGSRVSNKSQVRSAEFCENNSKKISDLWQDPAYREKQKQGRAEVVVVSPLRQAVVVDGITYNSITAAAEAHGVTKQGAKYRLQTSTFPNWEIQQLKDAL